MRLAYYYVGRITVAFALYSDVDLGPGPTRTVNSFKNRINGEERLSQAVRKQFLKQSSGPQIRDGLALDQLARLIEVIQDLHVRIDAEREVHGGQ